MRIILLSIAFIFLAFSAQAQVLKSAGVWYFLDVDSMTARPAVLPNGTELAYVVGTKTVYYWNRNTSTWTAYGSTFGRDSIYFDSSIIGSGTVSDPWGIDSTLFATIAGVGDSLAAALTNYLPILGGTLTGTGGAGFIGFPSQVTAPGTPASGLNVYAQGSSFNWKGTDGYERLFASTLTGGRTYTLPDISGTFALGTGTADRSARWSATNTLAAGNITDNGTKLQALLPWQFQTYTTAGLPSGVTGYHVYNTTTNGPGWYQGSRWAYGLEGTFNRGTSGYFPRFDANGQIIDSEARVSSTNMIIALTGGLQIPSGTSAQQASTGAGYLRWNTSLAYPTIFNGSSTQSVLIGPFTGFASGEVMYGASSGGMPSSATTFRWDITNSRLLVGTNSYSFSASTRFVVQQSTANAFIADFRQTSSTAFAPLAIMKLTRTDNTVGYGGTFAFYFNNSANAEVDYARFGSLIETNTSGSHSGALAFYTTAAAVTTNERMRISSIGRIGINTTTPTHRLHVNGRARIDTTDATPTSLLGVDGSNVLGKFTLGTGLSITSGTLNATGGSVTSVGLSLPAIFSVSGSPVTSSGTLSASFTGGNTRQVLRGDGIWANTLDSFRINQSLASLERFEVNGNLVLSREDEGHKLMLSRGWIQQIWGGGVTGDMTFRNGSGAGFQNYFILGTSASADTVVTMHGSGLGVYAGKANKLLARLHVRAQADGTDKAVLIEDYLGADILTITGNKLIQAHAYGTSATTAATLGLTESGYIAGFDSNGKIYGKEQKRDTTIYVDDADYDFSAALTTAQISRRYNRVIFWMTTTAAAGTDSELTLHTPDANLMQVEYLIHSVDEAGGFANVIRFGSNNAVDSTNGLVSSYFPAAGDGIHIRAGLRSAAYKYRYSN